MWERERESDCGRERRERVSVGERERESECGRERE